MDFILENMWQTWAIIAVICLILELTNGDFFIICFSIGAVFSAIAAAVGIEPMWQLAVFSAFSVLSLLFLRPWAKKRILRTKETRVSNSDAIIGRVGRICEPIEQDGYGRIAIDGDEWKAQSVDGAPIAAGERAKIIARESIIVTVEKI